MCDAFGIFWDAFWAEVFFLVPLQLKGLNEQS